MYHIFEHSLHVKIDHDGIDLLSTFHPQTRFVMPYKYLDGSTPQSGSIGLCAFGGLLLTAQLGQVARSGGATTLKQSPEGAPS